MYKKSVFIPKNLFFSSINICLNDKRIINNADTSVPSIHSSGCDSGVGLTAQLNDASIKQVIKLMPDLPRRASRSNILMNNKRNKRCVCGYAATGIHVCSEGEESR